MNKVHEALDALLDPIVARFEDGDPLKVHQLTSAVATVHMVLDQLEERASKPSK